MTTRTSTTIRSLRWLLFVALTFFGNATYGQIVIAISSPAPSNDTLRICEGTQVNYQSIEFGFTNPIITWSFTGGSPTTAGGNGPHSVMYNTAGSYIAVVTAIELPNIASDTIHVVVSNTVPNATFNPPATSFCSSDSPFPLTGGSPAGGTYSGPGVTNGIFDPEAAGPGTHTICYTVNENGCVDSSCVTFTLTQGPDASISDQDVFTPFANCVAAGGSSTYTLSINNSSTTQGSNTSYYINWGDGSAPYTGATLPNGTSHTYTSLGNFTITVVVSSGNGCADTNTYNFFNGQNPNVGIGIGSSQGCVPFTLNVPILNTANNPPGTTYEVEFGDGTIQYYNHPPPDTISYTYLTTSCGTSDLLGNPNSYYVRIRATNPCGTTQALASPIEISQAPQVDLMANDSTICVGQALQLTDISDSAFYVSGGNCTSTYTRDWIITPSTGWTITGGNGPNPVVTFTDTGSYSVCVAVQHPCGNDTACITVCVGDDPELDISTIANGTCAPMQLTVFNNSDFYTSCFPTQSGFVINGTDSSWSAVNGTSTSSDSAVFQFDTSGTYTVTYYAVNDCDSVWWDTTVIVGGPPVVTLPPDELICELDTLELGATGNNGNGNGNGNGVSVDTNNSNVVEYRWYISPNTGWSYVNGSGPNDRNPTVAFTDTGAYLICLAVETECGVDSACRIIQFNTGPDIAVSPDTTICYGEDAVLGVSVLLGNPPYTYRWRTVPPSGFNSNSDSIIISGLTSTTTYSIRVTDSLGCESDTTVTVFVNPELTADAGLDFTICAGDSFSLSGSITGGTPPYNVHWSPGSDMNDSTLLNPTVTDIGGDQTFILFVTDSLGCTATDTVAVSVYQPILNVNAGPDTLYCNSNVIETLQGFSPPGGTWTGSGIVPPDGFNPSLAGTGTHQLIYSFTDSNGCSDQDTVLITVIDPVAPAAGPDTAVCVDSDSIQLTGIPMGGVWTTNGPASILSGSTFFPTTVGTFDLYYTTGYGSCELSDTITIVVNDRPTIGGPFAREICSGDSIVFIPNASIGSSTIFWEVIQANGITGATTSGTGFIADTLFNNSNTPDSIVYNIWAVGPAPTSCGGDTTTLTVVVNPLPQITNPIDTFEVCSGDLFTFIPTSNVAGTSFDYITVSMDDSIAGGSNGSGSIGDILTNDGLPGYIHYQIVATGPLPTSCVGDTMDIYVLVNPLPVADAGPDLSYCTNDSIQLQAVIPPGYTWTWNPTIGLSNPTASQPTVVLTNTGTTPIQQDYILVVTDTLTGCVNTDTVTVTVNPLPNVSAGPDRDICIGDSTIIGTTTDSSFTYSWFIPGNAPFASTGTVTVSPDTSTTYRLIQIDTATGCLDSADVRVTVIPSPVAGFIATPDSSCSPLNVTFTDTSSPGVTHQWYLNGQLFSNQANPALTLINNSNSVDSIYTITLIVTNASGCADTTAQTVVVHPMPDASFTAPTPFCAPDSITTTFTGSVPVGSTFDWNVSSSAVGVYNATDTTASFVFPDLQGSFDSTYTIWLIVTTANGCTDSVAQNVTLHARPIAGFSIPANSCGPATISVSNSAVGTGLNYVYTVNPNSGVTFSNPNAAEPDITFPQSTSDSVVYTIYQTVIDSRGCADFDSARFVIYPTPTAGFTASANDSCGPFTVSFSNTSSPNQTGMDTSSMVFAWDFGNGQTSSSANAVVTFTNSGTSDTSYIVQLIVTNAFGCLDTAYDTITVHPDPIAQFSASLQTSCAPFVIDSSVVNLTLYPNANDQYIWQVIDPNTQAILATYNGPFSLSHTLIDDGDTVLVRLIATSPYGCSNDTLDLPFYTIEDPQAGFIAVPDSGCAPLNVQFTDTSTVGVAHSWYVDGVLFSNLTNPSITLTNTSNLFDSTYTITLIITSGAGCSDTTSQQVVVHPMPDASFTIPSLFCAPDSVAANFNGVVPVGSSFAWGTASSSVTIYNSTDSNASFVFPDFQGNFDSTYTIWLVVTTPNGCTDSVAQDVTVYARPTAGLTAPLNSCGPATISITSTASGSNLSYSYLVQPSAGVAISNPAAAQPTITFPASTSDSVVYTIYQTVLDDRGCSDVDSIRFTIYPTPTAGFTVTANDSCGPFTVNFSNTSSPNQTGMDTSSMTFSWNFGNGQTSTSTSPSVTFINTGTSDTSYTVQLIATNAFGCSDTIHDTIVVHPDPIAQFTAPNTTACAPFTIDSSVVSAALYPSAVGQYIWEVVDLSGTVLATFSGPTSINYTMLTDGDTVIVRLISTSPYGCSNDTLSMLFNTIPDPIAGFVANPDSGCGPLNVQLTDTSTAGVTHQWYIDGVLFSSQANPSITLTNTSTSFDSTYTITLIVTSGAGCSDTASTDIVVFSLPVADFNASEACLGEGTLFTDLSVGNQAIVAWDWDFGDGNTDTVQNPIHIYATPGVYVATLTITDARGCQHTTSDSLIVRPRPVANFNASGTCGQDTLCINLPSMFYDLSTVAPLGAPITTWAWDMDMDGITDYTTDSVNHVFTTSGQVDVQLIVSTQYGCTDTIVRSYYILTPPNADFALDTTYGCGPLQVNATNLSSGTISSYAWVVYADNGSGGRTVLHTSNTSSSGTIPTLAPSNIQDTTYYIELTVGNCCGFDTITRAVTVRANPRAGLLPDNSVGCSPMNVQFQIDGQVSGAPDYLIMDYGDGTVDTIYRQPLILPNGDTSYIWGAQNHQFIYNGPNLDTIYVVTQYAVNPCGIDTATVNITVRRETVNAFINASPRQGCAPLTVTFANASFRGQNFTWCLDYDTITGNCTQPAVGDTIVYTYTQPGTYTVALFANDNCTFDTAYVTIEVYETPNVQFTANDVCIGGTTVFTNNTTINNGFISSYSWDFGDGTTSFLVNPTHVYQAPGVYPVTLIVNTTNGCPDTLVQNVVVHPGPVVDFVPVELCFNEQPFTIDNLTDTLQTPIASTFWDFGDGTTSTDYEPTHSYSTPGVYTISLVHTTTNGCTDSISYQAVIHALPTAQFDTTQIAGGSCGSPQTYQFTNQSIGATRFFWDFDYANPGTNTDTTENPTVTFSQAGVYDIQLIVENGNGCFDTAYGQIIVYPFPTANFEADTLVGCTPLTVTFTSTSLYNFPVGSITNYTWDFGDGTTQNSTRGTVTHTYTQAGVYDVTLWIETSAGCRDSITIQRMIQVYPRPEAAFTYQINNDGTVQFINQTQFVDANTTFIWDFGDGVTSTLSDPTHDFNALRYEQDVTFSVCLYVQNPYGCPDSVCIDVELLAYRLEVPNAFAPDLIGVGDGNVFLPKGNNIAEYHLEIFDAYGNKVFESTALDIENGIPTESWDGTFFNDGSEDLPAGAYVWKINARFIDGFIWPGKRYKDGRVLRFGTVTLIR